MSGRKAERKSSWSKPFIPVKDGATGGRIPCKLHEAFDPRCPVCTMPAPLPVAEFECWTCGTESARANGQPPRGMRMPLPQTTEKHRAAGHDVRPAGGKRP